jgi:hypothetical protein
MAALFFNSHSMELSPALGNVGELKNVIANSVLKASGFTDVVDTQSEVAGNRSGVRLSVLHLHISGPNFWQVVMAAGDAGNVTLQAVNEVVDKIKNLKFL